MPEVSQFGAFRFNEAVRFNESLSYDVIVYTEGYYGLRVAIIDAGTQNLKAVYGSDQEENPVISVEFDHVESGCGSFVLKVNKKPEDLVIERNDRVDIHLMGTDRPWYSGRVQDIPGVSSKLGGWQYGGHGYFEELDNIIVNEDYQNMSVANMVIDLAQTYLGGRDILFFSDQFMSGGYTAQHVQFDRSTFKGALKKLAELAHNYVFGINEDRQLFFRPQEGRPLSRYANKASHWLGYNLDSFELAEDTKKIHNIIHVKIGEISAEDSNFADFILEDLDSIAFFGERAKALTAPELKNQDDAQTWAQYKLEEAAWPMIKGSAGMDMSWVTGKEDMLRAEGFLRASLARGGLVTPYYEPLNGYFRYMDIGISPVFGSNWLKREFTCRQVGNLGRVRIMVQRIGSPGNLTVRIKEGTTVLDTVNIGQSQIPDWISWVDFDVAEKELAKSKAYTIEVYASAGDASNYYNIIYSTYDSPFFGAYYSSSSSGSSWSEDTGKGIIFKSYLVHDDEFILAIKKVAYKAAADGSITAKLSLGEMDQPLEDRVLALLRDIQSESLLQQSNVADLSS